MPHISLPTNLPHGPLIDVVFGFSVPRVAILTRQGQANIPAPCPARGLIDTGASVTCIDPKIALKLGLIATGSSVAQTASTQGVPHVCKVYDVFMAIILANGRTFTIPTMPVAEMILWPQGIDALIGRDVLSRAAMFYDGPSQKFTISF